MKRIAILFAAALTLFACGNDPSYKGGIPKDGTDPEEGQEAITEEITVPEEYADFARVALKSSITKVQPMTGIVMWAPYRSEDISLEYSYMQYNDICKEKDKYDWTVLDNLLEGIASRGHQAVIRFHYTYVGKKCTVPDYIKAWPGYEETVGKPEGRTTYFPDWRCEELKRFHLEFYKKLAERYDKDPRLAFLETGFGLWAEYHIYDGPFKMGQTFPDKDFQAEFMRGMSEWFKETTWSISIDSADNTYGPFQKYPDLLDLRFGNFDDSFMCQDHDGYNYRSWLFFGETRYKRAPLGGEFSYYSDYDQEHCLDAGGMYHRKFEDEVAKFHMTFIIGADQPGYQSWSRIREASLSMGYKFRIRDFRVKDGKAALLVANVGVAPIYRNAWIAVDGTRSEYNLAQLMPGNEIWIEVAANGISAKSVPTIECDHLVSGQKICFEADID